MRAKPHFIVNLWISLALMMSASAANSADSAIHKDARPVARWLVSTQPIRIVNGSPILFRVATPRRLSSLSGNWLEHEVIFNFDERTRTWFALAGASQDTKPGEYFLKLSGETSTDSASATAQLQFEKQIHILRQRYPRIQLKVPSRYTAPSPEDQREIAQDKETKADVFKTVSPERAWQGSFAPPVDAAISDVFGVERVFNGSVQSTHQGLDFRVSTGTPVAAVNSGHVILARPLFFEGNCVVIDHGQGLLTLYLHLSQFSVKEGDEIRKGQEIGRSGGTGRATGPHLHLAVRWQGVYLDPQTLLKLKLP
jgi:murein DD-endopeptidase MepM/ murein hydrolase activator NlpD